MQSVEGGVVGGGAVLLDAAVDAGLEGGVAVAGHVAPGEEMVSRTHPRETLGDVEVGTRLCSRVRPCMCTEHDSEWSERMRGVDSQVVAARSGGSLVAAGCDAWRHGDLREKLEHTSVYEREGDGGERKS